MPWAALDIYQREYVDRNFERLDLLQTLAHRFGVARGLYPGSYCHVTPSFVIPEMVYVDSDRRAARFFADPDVLALTAAHKVYDQNASWRFYAQDYSQALPEPEESFDLLLSQWAGPVSAHCGRYLRPGGLLLANNSHADAGLAALDPAFELIATVHARGGSYRLSEAHLERYLVPKRGSVPTREGLLARGRGVAYAHTASMYLFRRVC